MIVKKNRLTNDWRIKAIALLFALFFFSLTHIPLTQIFAKPVTVELRATGEFDLRSAGREVWINSLDVAGSEAVMLETYLVHNNGFKLDNAFGVAAKTLPASIKLKFKSCDKVVLNVGTCPTGGYAEVIEASQLQSINTYSIGTSEILVSIHTSYGLFIFMKCIYFLIILTGCYFLVAYISLKVAEYDAKILQ